MKWRNGFQFMNPENVQELTDNPQGPEFASWRSFRAFERRVVRERRHIWGTKIQAFLDTVLATLRGRDMEILVGSILWRAQIGIDLVPLTDDDGSQYGEEPIGLSPERMKPTADYSIEGRANAAGIPVLYLASTKQTAMSEVRPWVGSDISVAQFKIIRNLRVIDLTQGHGESSWQGMTTKQLLGEDLPDMKAKERAVWIDIDNAFSRPVTLSDNKEHYIPTRILAELFQEAGYDALVYRSQFGQGERPGYNVALFRLEDADIASCVPCTVESIEVNFKEIGTWYVPRADVPADH